MDGSGALSARVAEAARALQTEVGSEGTMTLAVELAVELIVGCDDAAITVVNKNKSVETAAFTSERVLRVDQLQYEHGDGPCLSAIWDEEVVSCPDLANDERWGGWGTRAAGETGIGSMLCFRIFTHETVVGALNLYADAPHAFDGEDVDRGRSFAAHAAIAVVVARRQENLAAGLDSRSLIGQAQGILMERYQIDAVRAFAVLTRVSQNSNRKLHDIAVELIQTGAMPGELPRS